MAKKKERIIFHVDMDHFFTAVEEREHPEIKGRPVVVGAPPKGGTGRGVVSTSNYEARKYGVKSGISIARAWRLCPEAVYLPVNYRLYQKVSAQIMTILRSYADKFELWGLDEAFLDVTSRVTDFVEAEKLAQKIKKHIRKKEDLTCSIGIASNKLVAKIGSDFKKPDGLTVVRPKEALAFLAPLDVRRLLWVGKKTESSIAAAVECDPDVVQANRKYFDAEYACNKAAGAEEAMRQRKSMIGHLVELHSTQYYSSPSRGSSNRSEKMGEDYRSNMKKNKERNHE